MVSPTPQFVKYTKTIKVEKVIEEIEIVTASWGWGWGCVFL